MIQTCVSFLSNIPREMELIKPKDNFITFLNRLCVKSQSNMYSLTPVYIHTHKYNYTHTHTQVLVQGVVLNPVDPFSVPACSEDRPPVSLSFLLDLLGRLSLAPRLSLSTSPCWASKASRWKCVRAAGGGGTLTGGPLKDTERRAEGRGGPEERGGA